MEQTKRQRMVLFLKEPKTIWDLRKEFGGTVKDIVDHLEHIKKSVSKRMSLTPSECWSCGFKTKKEKFVALSRCPKCRSKYTTDPIIQIRK